MTLVRAVISGTFLIVLLSAGKIEAQATVRRVPADHPTIQQAINASVNGDTVLVAPGTYVENINFLGKAITVTSDAGPDVTIIDGGDLNSVVRFTSLEESSSILVGFTIKNGNGHAAALYEGGGIKIEGSSPTIIHNIITNNTACAFGAGIAIAFGSPIIQQNIITRNNQRSCGGGLGGGISIRGGSPQILDNVISHNSFSSGGGIGIFGADDVIIRKNLITNNVGFGQGGGIRHSTWKGHW